MNPYNVINSYVQDTRRRHLCIAAYWRIEHSTDTSKRTLAHRILEKLGLIYKDGCIWRIA